MYSVYSSLDCSLDGQSQDQEAKYIVYIIRIRKYFLCKFLCFLFMSIILYVTVVY